MSDVLKAIAVTAELTGTELSKAAILAMESDLSEYPVPAVLMALTRCRRELTGRLSPAAVIERLEAADGRPSANEAWGIALTAFDEAATVVMTSEIASAMEAARPVMAAGDEIGARMAFRDAYDRTVRENRAAGQVRPQWFPSLGSDPLGHVDAIQAAVDKGRLTHQQASAFLPAPMTAADHARGAVIAGLLTGTPAPMPDDEEFKSRIKHLVGILQSNKS